MRKLYCLIAFGLLVGLSARAEQARTAPQGARPTARTQRAPLVWEMRFTFTEDRRDEHHPEKAWDKQRLDVDGRLRTPVTGELQSRPGRGDPVWEEAHVRFQYSGRIWKTRWSVSEDFTLKGFQLFIGEMDITALTRAHDAPPLRETAEKRQRRMARPQGLPPHLSQLLLPSILVRKLGQHVYGFEVPAAQVVGIYPNATTVEGEPNEPLAMAILTATPDCPIPPETQEERERRLAETMAKISGGAKTAEELDLARLRFEGPYKELHPQMVLEGTRTCRREGGDQQFGVSWQFRLLPQ